MIKFPNGRKLQVYYNSENNTVVVYFKNTNKLVGAATYEVRDRIKQLQVLEVSKNSNYLDHLRKMTEVKNKLFELLGGSDNE